jgi:hypothetical protein
MYLNLFVTPAKAGVQGDRSGLSGFLLSQG